MKVLFCASEIYPYAKTGGLGDVGDALPKSLQKYADVAVAMPMYSFISSDDLQVFASFSLQMGGIDYEIEIYNTQNYYFIKAPLLSSTENLYGNALGDYASNDIRFGLFAKAIVELCTLMSVDILHVNDWHSALAPLFIKEKGLHVKSVLTIHNLAYQGIFSKESLQRLGLDNSYFRMEALEFYGKINFLKAGIAFCDALTTVSPSYAQEILTPAFGCGLDGFLQAHKYKLHGILNGINADFFDPKTDSFLAYNYDANHLEDKRKNKVAFLKKIKLKDPRKPLFIVLSRLVPQKGIDLICKALPEILAHKINLYILGDGEGDMISQLTQAALRYENFVFENCYDESLSHQAYAAADFVLMPSLFEPCGLVQMIAMRYGVIPIVFATGGLRDSVFEDQDKCGRGVVFTKYSKKQFLLALQRALLLQKDDALKKANMACDFSFQKSAKAYFEIYKALV
ncbi:MAG: glycogen synthase [Sulfurospirillum sp.]|nr:glycogen synthase [Sulfurospirillum sp.]